MLAVLQTSDRPDGTLCVSSQKGRIELTPHPSEVAGGYLSCPLISPTPVPSIAGRQNFGGLWRMGILSPCLQSPYLQLNVRDGPTTDVMGGQGGLPFPPPIR